MQLGEEFAEGEQEGLWALREGADVLALGFKDGPRSIRVDLRRRRAEETTVQDYDESECDFEEWLAGWQDKIKAAAAPYERQLSCAFCGKLNTEVRRLIAGPTCYICDECVELCSDILKE